MTESDKILTPEYLDWYAKLSGLPSVLTDKIRSKLYKRYKKQTGNEPWQLSEAPDSDPELIIKSEDEERDYEVPERSDQNNVLEVLPEDPEEKRKHIIGLVLEKFPYLSLDDSDEHHDTFNFDSSALCPLCNGDHKVNRSIFDEIKGEWGADEYYGERTYRLNCRESLKHGIPIVSVKA
ncbi:unnamed protein product [Rhizophagus irregularis]|nr:unnamed protein product [Rhizophagus irregularis]